MSCKYNAKKMRGIFALVLSLAVVAVSSSHPQRIVGGEETTIENYPSIVALLEWTNLHGYWQICGGTIINTRSILTAAHCVMFTNIAYAVRVGSTTKSTGGVLHSISNIVNHPQYNGFDHDISVIHTATPIAYTNAVQPGWFAGANYFPPDNDEVWAAGWGNIEFMGPSSEVLRHVQVWTINQDLCRTAYGGISDDVLCTGWWGVGGRDQCQRDSGGPVYHNGIVVGVCFYGSGCAQPYRPGLNVRVSSYIDWIQANA